MILLTPGSADTAPRVHRQPESFMRLSATVQIVSGHSLKHVVAALAAWPVWRALVRQPLRHND